jgi:CRISPR/Cas system endoribonuclease Cas6 (RAMP superfamily)
MLRIYLPFGFLILFLGWIAYRLFVKKDLRQHLNSLYSGLFFTATWLIIYIMLLR